MLKVYYERYRTDYDKGYYVGETDSLETLKDGIFSSMKIDFTGDDKYYLNFPLPDEYPYNEDGPGTINITPSRTSPKYEIYRIDRDGKVLFSSGRATGGKKFWNNEIKDWLRECENFRRNPSYNFDVDQEEEQEQVQPPAEPVSSASLKKEENNDLIVSKNIINEYCRSTFAYTDEELEDKRTEYADFSDLSRVPLAVTSNPYADPPYLVSVYADLKHNRINRYAGYEKVGGEGLVKSQKFGSLKEMNAWMAKNLYFEDLVKTTQDEFEAYDSMDNDQLYGALYDRLKAENDMYVENLLEKSPKDIYQSSLQTITQDDIICALQDEVVELPDGEDLRLMLKTGFNLNDAYLECDYLDIYSQLADSHDILFSEAAGYARTEMENELHKESKDARNGIAGYVQEFGKDSGTDKTKDAER